MHPASLPLGARQHLGDGGPETLVGVGHDQAHALETALDQRAQEAGPERLVFAGPAVHPEHPTLTGGGDADRDHAGDGDHAIELAHLVEGGIEDDVGALVLDGSVAKGLDLGIEHLAQPADLRLGDAVDAEGLDQVVDLAGGNTLNVGLDHDGVERLLGAPPWFEQRRKVGAAGDLGDLELDRADARVPRAGAIAVAIGGAL